MNTRKTSLNLILSCLAAAPLAISTASAMADVVEWLPSAGGNGHWYELNSADATWVDAQSNAESQGGHLVTLTTEQEFSFVYALSGHGVWIGAYQPQGSVEPAGGWQWVTGESWGGWAQGIAGQHFDDCDGGHSAPTCEDGCDPDGQQNLALMWQYGPRIDDVNEFGCPEAGSIPVMHPHTIEWSADCNDDGIVDYGQILDGTFEDLDGNGIPDCCDNQTCDLVQWTEAEGGNGHWYQLVDPGPGIAWTQAAVMAEDMGGHLATLTSEDESNFIILTLDPYRTRIGGYQDPGAPDYSEPGGGWRWVTGEAWGYTNWHANEPNDTNGGLENFLEMDGGGGIPGGWNDMLDLYNGHDAFLVEWSADCNGDGIVDYGQILDGTYEDLDNNGVPDCCDAGIPCDGSVTGPIQWADNGHVYELVLADYLITWPDARDESATRGGHLATLTSAAENDFVFNQLASNPDASIGAWGPWIGANADGVQWNWPQTGEAWDFEAWAPGEPGSAADNKAAGYWQTSDGVAQWADHHEFLELAAYVMEWSADCNGDGLVDYAQILDGQLDDDNGNGVPDSCDCPSDVDNDGVVNVNDVLVVLAEWGTTNPLGDANGDGIVDVSDVLQVIADWGMDCP